MELARKRAPSAGSSSTLTLTTFRRPAWRSKRLSSPGAIIRHGPHHGAHRSTTTGTEALASASNEVVSAATSHGSITLHFAHRGTPRGTAPTRLRAAHDGHRSSGMATAYDRRAPWFPRIQTPGLHGC